ncbi:MAG: glycosyltransferase family 9 protein [Bacteroidales bacterium]|nr:glycosyltransferase family 9 protein [Bacteroidales bacterium]
MVKFLIIRFSSIGDIVLTSPVIRCMKTQIEDAEIHYLTKAKYEPILIANPHIDKLHLLRSNCNALIKKLQSENFDYVIDLHNNIRSFRIKSALNRISFSFHKLNFRKWLLVNFKIHRLPKIHIVDRYLQTTNVFSVVNDQQGLDFFIPKDDQEEFKIRIDQLPGSFAIIVVGGGHNTKQIPVNKIQYIIDHLNCPVVLLGGPEDIKKTEMINYSEKKDVFDFVGKLTVNQSALVIKDCRVILTPDTGLMHIAAAFKKPILSIWGNTVPEFGMYPYCPDKNSEYFEVRGLKCRPCSKIGFSKCPKKHFNCMNNQDYQKIIKRMNTFTQN